jgi:hypothetical protein
MNNIINNWSWKKPTEPGDYLVCYGDVETPANVSFVRFTKTSNGELYSFYENRYTFDAGSYKFARLVYSPTEIKEIEG